MRPRVASAASPDLWSDWSRRRKSASASWSWVRMRIATSRLSAGTAAPYAGPWAARHRRQGSAVDDLLLFLDIVCTIFLLSVFGLLFYVVVLS